MSGQVPEQRWMGSGQVPMHRPASPPPVETISEADYYVTDGVAVDPNYYWRPMSTCPLGTKVQLLTKGGIATHGYVNKGLGCAHPDSFDGWTPLPKKLR